MRISIRGTDRGNAMLYAIVLIMVLSTIFISIVPRIGAIRRYAEEYKARVVKNIEDENRRLIELYDLD